MVISTPKRTVGTARAAGLSHRVNPGSVPGCKCVAEDGSVDISDQRWYCKNCWAKFDEISNVQMISSAPSNDVYSIASSSSSKPVVIENRGRGSEDLGNGGSVKRVKHADFDFREKDKKKKKTKKEKKTKKREKIRTASQSSVTSSEDYGA